LNYSDTLKKLNVNLLNINNLKLNRMKRVFPFGSPLKKVEQQDRSPKKVFILGGCANAVHAKWIDAEGNVNVEALPVVCEPSIFWEGENAEQIVQSIQLPPKLGKLLPADKKDNWDYKMSMRFELLRPLGIQREEAWFCYLMPYPRLTQEKFQTIEDNYNPLAATYNLPESVLPIFNPSELSNPLRLGEILVELKQSQADTIVLLGDLPVEHFLSHFSKYKKLSDFEEGLDDFGKLINYGKKHKVEIDGKLYNVIPLIGLKHFGKSENPTFRQYHRYWIGKGVIYNSLKKITGRDPSLVAKMPKKCPICHEKEIATCVYENPPLSESLQEKIKNGEIVLKDTPMTKDDPAYMCRECGFEFYMSL